MATVPGGEGRSACGHDTGDLDVAKIDRFAGSAERTLVSRTITGGVSRRALSAAP
jgi:hypothetical protein